MENNTDLAKKSFGDLLKESLSARTDMNLPEVVDKATVEHSLDDTERSGILERLGSSSSPSSPDQKVTPSDLNEDLSTASFGDLLKRTIDEQKKLSNEDTAKSKETDEIREFVIKKSKPNLIEEMMKGFGK